MATTRKPTRAAEAFSAYLAAAHQALVAEGDPTPSLAKAEQALAAISPELAAVASAAVRELSDRIAASVRAAGPAGYAVAIRRAEASNLDNVVIAVARAIVSEPTRQNLTDAEAALAEAVELLDTAKADLALAIKSGDVAAMRSARDVIDVTGPKAVDEARAALGQAQLAAAQEAERIAVELPAPQAKATAAAVAAAAPASHQECKTSR